MKKQRFIITVLSILLFVAIMFISYDKLIKNSSYNEKEKGILNVYGSNSNGSSYLCNSFDNYRCNDIVIKLKTETSKPLLIKTSQRSSKNEFSYVLYQDNGLKLYNINDKTTLLIDIDITKCYNIDFLNSGILYQIDENFAYFDFKTQRNLYTNYDILRTVEDNNSNSYIVGKIGNKYDLINIDSDKIIISRNSNNYVNYTYHSGFIISSILIEDIGESDTIFYNVNGKEIYHLKNNEIYDFSERDDTELIIYEKNITRKYFNDGTIIK